MEGSFKIEAFNGGINEYLSEGLLSPNEAIKAINCNVDNGSLSTTNIPETKLTFAENIHSLMAFYNDSSSEIICGIGTKLKNSTTDYFDISGSRLDSLNFEYNGKKIMVCTSKDDVPFMIGSLGNRKLKNRRTSYNAQGEPDGFIDADGKKVATEDLITTYAPSGDFVELHYDRIWIAGNKDNPDRIYFSTAGVNGADIEDFTIPTEEAEANMHGGFLDVRSYDGGKIIGLKVVFNAIVIFKNKSAYKIFGSDPTNYELVQMFSSNGAIADKSICVGDNGAFFLNNDGIYFYDGTNTNLISQKIQKTINSMNKEYSSLAVGHFFNNKYYLAIPTSSSNTNDLLIEYNTLTKSFITHQIGSITGFVEHNNELLYSTLNTVKSLNKGIGANTMLWESPYYDYGSKNSIKNSSYLYFRGTGDGVVRFTLISDKKTKVLEVLLDGTEKIYKKKFKNKGRYFKLKIENVNGSSLYITSPELITEIDED